MVSNLNVCVHVFMLMKCVSKGPCLEFLLNFLGVFVIDFFSIKFLKRFRSIGEKVAQIRSKKEEFLQS